MADFLLVRRVTARLDDHNLTLPDKTNCSLDGTVLVAIPVPIGGDKVYVRTNHNAAVMDLNRGARDVKSFFDGDVLLV